MSSAAGAVVRMAIAKRLVFHRKSFSVDEAGGQHQQHADDDGSLRGAAGPPGSTRRRSASQRRPSGTGGTAPPPADQLHCQYTHLRTSVQLTVVTDRQTHTDT